MTNKNNQSDDLTLDEMLRLGEMVKNWDGLSNWGDFATFSCTKSNIRAYYGILETGSVGDIGIMVGRKKLLPPGNTAMTEAFYELQSGRPMERRVCYFIGAESVCVIPRIELGYYGQNHEENVESGRSAELFKKAENFCKKHGMLHTLPDHAQREREQNEFYERMVNQTKTLLFEKARRLINP